MQPFTKRLVELLPNQFHSKAVQTDGFLRVDGAPKGTVYAVGDASTVGPVRDVREPYRSRLSKRYTRIWSTTCLSFGTSLTRMEITLCKHFLDFAVGRRAAYGCLLDSDYDEWQQMAAHIRKRYPLASKNFEKMWDIDLCEKIRELIIHSKSGHLR